MWATGFAIGSADLTGDAGTSATQNGFAPLQNDRAFLSTSATAGTTTNETLVAAEDTLLANAGADINGDIPDDHALDGSGSTDGFGSIGTYTWTGPGACQLTQPDNALSTATVACATGISGGEITLEITDVDGATASDVLSIDVGPPTTTTTTTTAPPTTTTFSYDFSDAPLDDVADSSFAHESIDCIFNLRVTTGTSPGIYSPDDDVTRAQMAAFMTRIYESMTAITCDVVAPPFDDVPDGQFYSDPVACIFGLKVTTGTGPTTFAPTDPVTRGQMAAFLDRLFVAVWDEPCPGVTTPFVDVSAERFYTDSVGCLFALDLTTGTSATTYAPDEFVTRAQMAAFLARFYEAAPASLRTARRALLTGYR